MAVKPNLCVYCAKKVSRKEAGREHPVPRCLWAGPRPAGTATVPAHRDCNAAYAKDDEFFRDVVVAMRGTDRHPEARVLIDGEVARNFERRPHLLAQHLQDLGRRPVLTPSGLFAGSSPAFEVDSGRLSRVFEKITRGLFYFKRARLLAPTHEIEWYPVNDETLSYTQAIVPGMRPFASFGDTVFRYRYYFHSQDQDSSAWLLVFYHAAAFVTRSIPSEVARRNEL